MRLGSDLPGHLRGVGIRSELHQDILGDMANRSVLIPDLGQSHAFRLRRPRFILDHSKRSELSAFLDLNGLIRSGKAQ